MAELRLDDFPIHTRVRTPSGIYGRVIKIVPRFKFPILVLTDIGTARAYAPSELTLMEPRAREVGGVVV